MTKGITYYLSLTRLHRSLVRLVYWCICFLYTLNVSAQTGDTTFWWNDAVFYEVFVRSFKDSDGDGNGDLNGLKDKLDYLNDGNASTHEDLGITGLWLMPVQQSPSYHGYDITDYRTVESDYGTNQDFKDLIDAAHQRGMKVIVDLVMNHTSSQHPWFQSSASSETSDKRDWYVWQNPAPTITGPWGQTVWYPKNGSNYYAVFWSEMPDLNYRTEAVKSEMFDVARFWLEDMHADGFRLDAVKYIFETGSQLEDAPETLSFWEDFRTYITSVKTDAFAVGEAWSSTDKVAPYVNNNGLHYCFEFDLASSIVTAANNGTASALTSKMEEVMSSYPFLQFGTFLTNHDMNRVMDQLSGSTVKAKLAASLLLTLPGIPYLYYGEEIGMKGSGADENKRTPLQWDNTAQAGFTSGTPWHAVNADYTSRNIVSQQTDPTSLWSTYRDMISLRMQENALKRGSYHSVSSSESAVFAFLRQYGNEHVMVVCNTGPYALSNVALNLTQSGIIPGTYAASELLGNTGISVTVDVQGDFNNVSVSELPARSIRIYKLIDATVASVESWQSSGIQIYPVPSDGDLYIRLDNDAYSSFQYSISDLSGKVMQAGKIHGTSGLFHVSCNDLFAGFYLLKISYAGSIRTQKIVIKK